MRAGAATSGHGTARVLVARVGLRTRYVVRHRVAALRPDSRLRRSGAQLITERQTFGGKVGSSLVQFLITTLDLEEPTYEHPFARRRPGGGAD